MQQPDVSGLGGRRKQEQEDEEGGGKEEEDDEEVRVAFIGDSVIVAGAGDSLRIDLVLWQASPLMPLVCKPGQDRKRSAMIPVAIAVVGGHGGRGVHATRYTPSPPPVPHVLQTQSSFLCVGSMEGTIFNYLVYELALVSKQE